MLAKAAARSDSTNYGHNRIPKSAILHEAAEEAIKMADRMDNII